MRALIWTCLTWLCLLGSSRGRWLHQHGAVQDLDAANFDVVLSAVPEAHPVMVEFYASWCPACRMFASTYADVAQVIGSIRLAGPAAQSGAASSPLIARVDCAREAQLCSPFSPRSYPYITVGRAGMYLRRRKSALKVFPSQQQRRKENIVRWATENLGLQLDESAMKGAGSGGKQQASLQQKTKGGGALTAKGDLPVWTLTDVESATLFLYRQVIMADPALHSGTDKRAALKTLLKLWAAGHPSRRCQGPAQVLVAFFDRSWPEEEDRAPAAVRDYKICGEVEVADKWIACAGSNPGARGFTCGLWLMFHTCAQMLPDDGERGVALMQALNAFNDHFFQCEVCHKHFTQVLATPAAKAVKTHTQAVTWLWQVHNEVNVRLMLIESKYGHSSSGDPAYPKSRFPSIRACPDCRMPTNASSGAITAGDKGTSKESVDVEPQWNVDAVYRYLDRVYGMEAELQQQALSTAGTPQGSSTLATATGGLRLANHPLVWLGGGMVAVSALLLLLMMGCPGASHRRGAGAQGGQPGLAPRGRHKPAS